jgi:ankyrin repeat protein
VVYTHTGVCTRSNAASDAQDNLAEQLHVAVQQILNANHAISVQLRELIAQRSPNEDVPFTTDTTDTTDANVPIDSALPTDDNLAAYRDALPPNPSDSTPESIPTSPSTPLSSAGSWRTSLFAKDRDDDAASIRTTATTASMRSFKEALRTSPVYKRLRRKGRDSDSVFSVESSEKGCAWSMLSDLSLGELSISEISVIELPICLSDLWDPAPYRVESASTVSSRRKSSARVNWSSRGRIHNAIAAGNDYVVRMLIGLGADIEEMDREGRSPLAHAFLHERDTIVKLLCEKGASVDSLKAIGLATDLNGGLETAVREGKETVVRMLLSMGADLESRDSQSRTPLAHAVLNKHESIVKLLLEKGASVDALKAIGTTTDLNSGLENAVREGKENVIRLLLIMGADVEERGSYNMTPLLYAAFHGKSTIVKILVEAGADMNARDDTGWTVLHCAATNDDAELVQFLLENGARDLLDVSKDDGYTPLHIAALNNNLSVAQLLVERGARLDLKNNNRQTPYQLARHGSPVAKYLWSQLSPDDQRAETPPR